MNRRDFLRGLGAAVGLVAVEPVRRYWAVGADLSKPPSGWYRMHESELLFNPPKRRPYSYGEMTVTMGGQTYAAKDVGGFTLSHASSLDPDFDYDDGSIELRSVGEPFEFTRLAITPEGVLIPDSARQEMSS